MSPSTHPFLYHLTGKVICQCSGLDHDVSLGVLELVPVGEPVTWCHLMVICAKKSGKPRRKVDFRALNFHARWETHHTQSPFHQARSVPGGTKKTVFNCWNGYHSVPLHPDDHHLHHPMGTVQVQNVTPGVHSIR